MLIPAAVFLISAVQSRYINALETAVNLENSLIVDTIPTSSPPPPIPPNSSNQYDMEIFLIIEDMPRFPGDEDQDLSKEA